MSRDTKEKAKAATPVQDYGHARRFGRGWIIKLVLMAILNALGLYGIWMAFLVKAWVIMIVAIVGLIILDWIYFSKRHIAAKYLAPGMAFLLIYQLFVMGYTGYIAFTNYGSGHNTTKDDAIVQIIAQGEIPVKGAATLPVAVVEKGSQLGLAILQENGSVLVGDQKEPMTKADATVSDGQITKVDGWKILDLTQIQEKQQQITELRVQASQDVNKGFYRTQDGSNAFLVHSRFSYDKKTDKLTETKQDGQTIVYHDNGKGSFVNDQGKEVQPGWRVAVGFENFKEMVTGKDIAKPFFNALIWSFVFAFMSVLTTFFLGLFLAIVFNDPRVRGRKIYRSLLILPYAFPGFLSALVWRGMMNEKYGFINDVLLGGASVPWLTNGTVAKISILLVNLWLGFPYMFLICTGALQSLPGDVVEAAKIDGASAWRQFRSITLPLVLVSTAPLLISSFAFNFNNFSLIYMLTGGGPNYPGASLPVGETDILISLVYAIAFEGGSQRYGLAAAMSIVIFIFVGLISWLGFRQTRKLEEMV